MQNKYDWKGRYVCLFKFLWFIFMEKENKKYARYGKGLISIFFVEKVKIFF